MRSAPVRIRRVVRELKNPTLRFVSLVDRPSNQTPFAVVRSAVHKPTTVGVNAMLNLELLAEIRFARGAYANKTAVKRALRSLGVTVDSDDDINTDGDDGDFVVRHVERQDGASYKEVADPTNDNIVYVLVDAESDSETGDSDNAERNADNVTDDGSDAADAPESNSEDDSHGREAGTVEGDATTVDTVEGAERDAGAQGDSSAPETDSVGDGHSGSAERRVELLSQHSQVAERYSQYMAEWSESSSLRDVLKEGSYDGPPGLIDVVSALLVAVRNAYLKNELDQISVASVEFAEVATSLAQMFQVQEMARCVDALDVINNGIQSTDWSGFNTTVVETDDSSNPDSNDNAAADRNAEALTAVTTAVSALTETVGNIATTLKEVTDRTNTRLDELSSSVEAQRLAFARKSDSTEGVETEDPQARARKRVEALRRNAFGSLTS